MNYIQFVLFIVFIFSALSAGIGIYIFLKENKESLIINRSIFIGEALLLGSIFLVGELLILSLLSLYNAYFLWSVVIFNFLFILNKDTRDQLWNIIIKRIPFNIPSIAFIILTLILIIRNCYFMIDIDSQSAYLFTQKLWLSKGTSIVGNIANDMRIFVPQFDIIPYGLGLSIFGQETLFPQLINLFWRIIVILLVFGYASYRFNKYSGLAAAMLVIFNDHFFYSGVNTSVLINAAVIAILFASSYNFWEGRTKDSSFCFLLAIIFLTQLLANKLQMIFVFFSILAIGILIQPNPFKKIKSLLTNKRWFYAISIAMFLTSLWFIKNLIITGDPFFPVFAGKFRIFNWIPEKEIAFAKIFGGLNPLTFIKYMNFLFIWPGVKTLKYIIVFVNFLPFILGLAAIRSKIEKDSVLEICFWLILTIVTIMGVCLINHQDPRYYRFPIAIASFATVFSLHYILKYCLSLKKELLISVIILLFSLSGYKVVHEGLIGSPTFKENIEVLTNKIHTDYAVNKNYAYASKVLKTLDENKDKLNSLAWGLPGVNMAFFLLPIKPVVSIWLTSVVRWDSYSSENLIINDLKKFGIKWVMEPNSKDLSFVPIENYAPRLAEYYRNKSKETYFNYGVPSELSEIK